MLGRENPASYKVDTVCETCEAAEHQQSLSVSVGLHLACTPTNSRKHLLLLHVCRHSQSKRTLNNLCLEVHQNKRLHDAGVDECCAEQW